MTQIKILINESATKQNIINELNWLREVSTDNDTVLFAFAGHPGDHRAKQVQWLSKQLGFLGTPTLFTQRIISQVLYNLSWAVTESIHTHKEIFQNGHPTDIQHH